jgi:hypothetical protein
VPGTGGGTLISADRPEDWDRLCAQFGLDPTAESRLMLHFESPEAPGKLGRVHRQADPSGGRRPLTEWVAVAPDAATWLREAPRRVTIEGRRWVVLRTRSWWNGATGYLERTWHPGRGYLVSLHGVDRMLDSDVGDWLDLAREPAPRGRPRRARAEPEFHERYLKAWQKWRKKHPDDQPYRKDIAALLGLHPRTFSNYIRDLGLPFPPE